MMFRRSGRALPFGLDLHQFRRHSSAGDMHQAHLGGRFSMDETLSSFPFTVYPRTPYVRTFDRFSTSRIDDFLIRSWIRPRAQLNGMKETQSAILRTENTNARYSVRSTRYDVRGM